MVLGISSLAKALRGKKNVFFFVLNFYFVEINEKYRKSVFFNFFFF